MRTLILSAFIVLFFFSPVQIQAQTDAVKTQNSDVDSTVYEYVEEMPKFPGEEKSYHDFFNKKFKYPYKKVQKGVYAKVIVSYIIEKDGTIGDVKLVKGSGLGFDDAIFNFFKKMPAWTSGKENGRSVRVKREQVIFFHNSRSYVEQNIEDGYSVYPHVEKMPEFPGGEKAFFKHILNAKSSEQAKRFGVHGTLIASFVIDEDGNPIDFKITRGLGFGLDEEAMDLLKGMPVWQPAMHNGQNIKVKYYVPINFKLNQ